MTKKAALLSCKSYDVDVVYEALARLAELVPPPDVAGKTVLIKPNILIAKKPEAAVCTHPAVVGAAVRLFKDRGASRVLAGESPATTSSVSAAKSTGIYEAVVKAGGEWVDFTRGTQVDCPGGKIVRQFTFAQAFAEADILVSVAKLKTHQLMAYTGAMKNLFGLMVGLDKAQSHFRFPEREDFSAFLTDLVIAAKPSYAIMDGIVAMEGSGGPGNGDPVSVNVLAASDNILALDWACSSLVGYNPHNVGNLEDALQRKLWLESADDIELVGDSFESLRPRSFKIVRHTRGTALLKPYMPKIAHRAATWFFARYPAFTSSCVRCGKCIEICPAKALELKRKVYIRSGRCLGCGQCKTDCPSAVKTEECRVVLDATKCLHCYCCHEICPHNAIRLRRKWV